MAKYKRRTVDVKTVLPVLQELIDRCGGIRPAAEYSGVSHQTLHNIRRRKHEYVRATTAGQILAALYRKRRDDRNGHATHPALTAKARRAEKIDRAYEQ